MRAFKLNDQETFEETKNAIEAREPFQLVADGFTATSIRKLRPFSQSHWGTQPKQWTRIDGLKYTIYGLFTGNFGAIYYAAFKAGMDARWEDTGASLVVSFEKRG